jgi:hypothetical protein
VFVLGKSGRLAVTRQIVSKEAPPRARNQELVVVEQMVVLAAVMSEEVVAPHRVMLPLAA